MGSPNTGLTLRPASVVWAALICLSWAHLAAADVTITEDTDEGIACFKVVTDSATYYFDKAGAGFTSILDADGIDWIDFHPEGTPGVPNGQSGWYRGIPNMGYNAFGHPGYTGATSTTADPLGVSLATASIHATKDAWDVTWEFFPTHARMTVDSVAENYWFLYEGTPGGAVGADDTCFRSSGESNPLSGSWDGDVSNSSGRAEGLEWVFFTDGSLDRSLFLAHDDDAIEDRYYLMDPMTVFGFGRQSQNIDRLMSATPATLLIGLVGSRDYDTLAQAIESAHSGTDGGTPDAGEPDAGEPDAGEHDAGEPDAGQPDAGDPDAGEPDAGEPDAGQPDAGEADAGIPDAGQADAGVPPQDADPGADGVKGSCGCDTNANPPTGAWLLAMCMLCWAAKIGRRSF